MKLYIEGVKLWGRRLWYGAGVIADPFLAMLFLPLVMAFGLAVLVFWWTRYWIASWRR
jgi:hypothetical protein